MLLFFLAQAALGCTVETSGRVVGFDAQGTRAVVRVERDAGEGDQEIDLVLLDLEAGTEAKRFVILTFDEHNDAKLRASRWKAAEAELTGLGLRFDAEQTAHALLHATAAVPVPGTEAVVVFGQDPTGEGWASTVRVHHGSSVGNPTELGRWPKDSPAFAVTSPAALWTTPRADTVLVQTAQGCTDPGFHVVHVPKGPATGAGPVTWCNQILAADTKVVSCSAPGVDRLPDPALIPNVEQLDLSGTALADLSGLERLPGLKALDLAKTQVRDLGPVASLKSLRRLDLEGTPVADLGPLGGLPELGNLNLNGTKVTDLGPLAGVDSLDTLQLEGTPVADLGPLAGKSLTDLRLSDTRVATLAPLAGMPKLRALTLKGTAVVDFGPLTTMPELHSVRIEEERHAAVRQFRSDVKLRK